MFKALTLFSLFAPIALMVIGHQLHNLPTMTAGIILFAIAYGGK